MKLSPRLTPAVIRPVGAPAERLVELVLGSGVGVAAKHKFGPQFTAAATHLALAFFLALAVFIYWRIDAWHPGGALLRPLSWVTRAFLLALAGFSGMALLVDFWNWSASEQLNGQPLLALSIAVLFLLIFIGWLVVNWAVTKRKSADTYKGLSKADEELLHLLSSIHPADADPSGRRRHVLSQFLGRTRRLIFKEVPIGCASVWAPDRRGSHLEAVASYRLPNEWVPAKTFELPGATSGSKPGVLGHTFCDKKLLVTRFRRRNDRVEVIPEDRENGYIEVPFDDGEPPYRAIITVPIVAKEGECIGVLCYDSEDVGAFNGTLIKEAARCVADHIAPVLDSLLKPRGATEPEVA